MNPQKEEKLMNIKKHIFGRWAGLRTVALCAMVATAIVGCKDDETDVVKDPHITLTENTFLYNATGESHSFTVYSNIDWKIEMADTSQTWVNIWPKEGSDDGVFAVKVSKQPSVNPAYREAKFRVVGKQYNNIIEEITVSQRGLDPSLKLGVTTTPPKVVISSNGESNYTVGVTSNVDWTAKVGESGEGWITIDNVTDNQISFSVPQYTGTVPRTGRIEFDATTERMTTVELIVYQSIPLDIGENAELKTIAEVYEKLGGLEGTIRENVKVQGTVISDQASGNCPNPAAFFVQDASGRAIQFRVQEGSHSLQLNSLVTVPLMNTQSVIDDNGQPYITISTERIRDVVVAGGAAITPKVLGSVSELTDEMLNSLVTIENLQYAFAHGTYFNANEGSIYSGGRSTDLPQLLLDKDGKTISNYVYGGTSIETGSVFKHYELLTDDPMLELTGIVIKMENEFAIRIRNINDRVKGTEARRYVGVTEFYWPEEAIADGTELTPKIGSGQLYVNFAPKAIHQSSSDFRLYSGAVYVRVEAAVKGDEKGYSSANCTGWGRPLDGLTVTQRAWHLATSTAGITDDLYICFSTTSSQSGPGPYVVEWATSENGGWNYVADYIAGNWEVTPGPKVFAMKLPDGCKNQPTLFVRFRISSDERVDKKGVIAAGGTNRMIYMGLKKKVN